MRKFYLFILGLMLSSTSLIAQSTKDTTAILQLCIDLPVFQSEIQSASIKSQKKTIMQYPITFSSKVIQEMDTMAVTFISFESIKAKKEHTYFVFRRLNVSQESAKTVVNYFYDYNFDLGSFEFISANVALEKKNGTWQIVDVNLEKKSR